MTSSDALLAGPDEAVTELRYPLKAPQATCPGRLSAK
jgi:hypothetical protein